MSRICRECRGSGKLLGGGFCQIICESCHGSGKRKCEDLVEDRDSDASNLVDEGGNKSADFQYKIDKRSKAYRDAIDELVGKGLSKEEAIKVFDEEYAKL